MSKLEDLEIYTLSMKISEDVWAEVTKWDYFCKDTLGKQWTRSIDSVSANISEGYGRFSFIEMRQFVRIARGSLMEHKTWVAKAFNRQLITKEVYDKFYTDGNILSMKINNFLKYLENKINNKTK